MSDFEDDDHGPSIGTYHGDRHPDTGARHGKGVANLPNGDKYEGQYQDGQRHGKGIYKFKSGARYDGEYMNGRKHGQGTFWYPDGAVYEGTWVDDVRSGHGKYTYPNGDCYEGEWLSGVKEGKGAYTYGATGIKYVGTWAKGVKSGEGTIEYAGMTYTGGFTDDQPLGAGVFKFAAGYQQPGEYVVSTDAGADAAEDEVRPITKWVGQLLATAAT
ncbi:uncharacterized protein MONBRDRAFT_32782 [Monosiga brevicollis MX1]|uniref:Radial spoke protein 1 n=1 Tax=Monosiga brevicollis TaxID=81824 RepID=A9V1N8_MONBE|nr:uncharacterized protein MONBRDRAFT_32782 [Monosiga brevicollis MX1]EDQ88474.1 predicted protein [Monosiga brevicollis MX1]|eukprot:XP_001746578.1 hypothetical protein [Monosiga brevicollis MX1]